MKEKLDKFQNQFPRGYRKFTLQGQKMKLNFETMVLCSAENNRKFCNVRRRPVLRNPVTNLVTNPVTNPVTHPVTHVVTNPELNPAVQIRYVVETHILLEINFALVKSYYLIVELVK